MQNIVILGSTGSIGESALKLLKDFPREFKVLGLSTRANVELLAKQVKLFNPEYVSINDLAAVVRFKKLLKGRSNVKVYEGMDGLLAMLEDKRIDRVLLAISGAQALLPLLKIIRQGKIVALANKEALVACGELVMQEARKFKSLIIPVDSEQSAIWQCLRGHDERYLNKIYLTASGGSLKNKSFAALKKITVKEVLKHPRWKMGKKITVDSATLMNKGLEVIEAMHLFKVKAQNIEVVIHPEAIIHSMVEFRDKVILAQLSDTDMRFPIQYAFTYPERMANNLKPVDFFKLKSLNFAAPDMKKFPCLGLAYTAAQDAGTMPCVLNAANEICVDCFLRGKLKFLGIPQVVEKVLTRHKNFLHPDLPQILEADNWARCEAKKIIGG